MITLGASNTSLILFQKNTTRAAEGGCRPRQGVGAGQPPTLGACVPAWGWWVGHVGELWANKSQTQNRWGPLGPGISSCGPAPPRPVEAAGGLGGSHQGAGLAAEQPCGFLPSGVATQGNKHPRAGGAEAPLLVGAGDLVAIAPILCAAMCMFAPHDSISTDEQLRKRSNRLTARTQNYGF